MTVIVTTREGKGSPLSHQELDANFTDLADQVNANEAANTVDHAALAARLDVVEPDVTQLQQDVDAAETDIADHESRMLVVEAHASTTTGNPHAVSKTDVGLSNVSNDAQLKRADNDYTGFTEETTPVMEDWVLIEKADGTKKKIQLGNVPSTGASSEADIYQDVLAESKYQHGTYDDFNDEDLVDGANTDASYSQNDTRYDFTVGEVIQSIDLYDSDAGLSEITECLVLAIYTDSGTPTIEATADGTNWEAITLNTVHTFSNTGTTLKLRFTAGGTGHLDSWAVFYNPDTQIITEPFDWSTFSPNILINSDFSVNQRNFAGGSLGSATYGWDRWRGGGAGATLSLSGDIMTISAGALLQRVEEASMKNGEVYTISWKGTAQLYDYGTDTFVSSPHTFTYNAAWGYGSGYCQIYFGTGTLEHPMLVPGKCPAPWVPRPVGEELALCQRYYEWGDFRSGQVGSAYNTAGLRSLIRYLVEKRTAPTVTLINNKYFVTAWDTPSAATVQESGKESFSITLTGTFTTRDAYLIDGGWNADAEL